jgi:hypothetical protein
MSPRKKARNFIRDAKESWSQWFLFTVLISLAPLLFSYFFECSTSVDQCPSSLLQGMSSHGEFFIVAASIMGDSLGDIFRKHNDKGLKLMLGSIGVILIMLSCLFFGALQGQEAAGNPEFVSAVSTAFLFTSISWGTACKVFGKM